MLAHHKHHLEPQDAGKVQVVRGLILHAAQYLDHSYSQPAAVSPRCQGAQHTMPHRHAPSRANLHVDPKKRGGGVVVRGVAHQEQDIRLYEEGLGKSSTHAPATWHAILAWEATLAMPQPD